MSRFHCYDMARAYKHRSRCSILRNRSTVHNFDRRVLKDLETSMLYNSIVAFIDNYVDQPACFNPLNVVNMIKINNPENKVFTRICQLWLKGNFGLAYQHVNMILKNKETYENNGDVVWDFHFHSVSVLGWTIDYRADYPE